MSITTEELREKLKLFSGVRFDPFGNVADDALDLFSGAGGMALGFKEAGYRVRMAVELNRHAANSYARNFSDACVFDRDIADMDFKPLRGRIGLVFGGPPCQPFSRSGKQLAHMDERDGVPHFLRAVRDCEPQAFVLENVANLASRRHNEYLKLIVWQLQAMGYFVSWKVLDAAHFGVPQHRERLFIVGIRGTLGITYTFPEPTHGKGKLPLVPVWQALGNAPYDVPNGAKVVYAKKPVLRPQPYDGMLVNGSGRPLNLYEPAPTIPASAGGNRTPIYDKNGVLSIYHRHLLRGGDVRTGIVPNVRRITVRESARLQSFPDWFEFSGPQSARYAQVGNAVPPPLAQAVALALREQVRAVSEKAG